MCEARVIKSCGTRCRCYFVIIDANIKCNYVIYSNVKLNIGQKVEFCFELDDDTLNIKNVKLSMSN